MLSAAAVHQVSRFCGTALDCDSLPVLQRQVLGAFEELFHYDSCVFHPRWGDTWQLDLSRCATRGCCADFVPKYLERYYREDPGAADIRDRPDCPPWGVRLSTEMVDYNTLVASRYYNDFLRPNHAHYSLIMVLGRRGRQIGVAVVSRSARRSDFSAADVLKAELIIPTLAAAVDRCLQSRVGAAQAWAPATLRSPGRGPEPAPLREPEEITGGGLQARLGQFGLSRRESEIALLAARGCSTPEISSMLCRSINTVETHLKSIFRKMGVNSRAGVAHRLYAP
ncbi:MAG: response regulator transcription factor [Gammaproteobacteria bacterium]|nr:response regulator transcription factor [Gammaproteobacteria bacterium]